MSSEQYALPFGTTINNEYRILRCIGHGGFSIAYLAEQLSSGKTVLVKELFNSEYMDRIKDETHVYVRESGRMPRFSKDRDRFLSEWEVMNLMKENGGIAAPLDYIESNNTAYIIMEHLSGGSLKDNVRIKGPYSVNPLLDAFSDVLLLLAKLHENGYVHRDISPDNLVMNAKDGKYKIIDFGATIKIGTTDGEDMLRKEGYTPAEMFSREYSASVQNDIYSLCAVFYYALTGSKPDDSLDRTMLDELRPLSEVCPEIDPLMDKLVTKGLSMDPEDRWKDVEELKQIIIQIRKTEQEKVKEEELKSERNKHKKRITLVSIAVAILFSIAAFCLTHKELLLFKNQETEKIVLFYPNDLSKENRNELRDNTIQKIEHIADSSRYLINDSSKQLEVTLPYALLEDKDLPVFLNQFFNFSHCHVGTYSYDFFDSAGKLTSDSIEGIDQNDGGCVITINDQLSDSLKQKEETPQTQYMIRTYTQGDGNNYWDLHNQPYQGDYYDITVSFDPDKNQIILKDSEIGGETERKLFIDCLTQKRIPLDSLNYERHIIWEQPEIELQGKYQKNISQIQGTISIFVYTSMTSDENEANIFQKAEAEYDPELPPDAVVLKNRLDSLQIPYACGWNAKNPSELYIATQYNQLWEVEAAMLFEHFDCKIKSANGVEVLAINNSSDLTVENNSVCVNLNMSDSIKETLQRLIKDDDSELQLCINDRPVLKTEIIEMPSDKQICFESFMLKNINNSVENQESFTAFINAIKESSLGFYHMQGMLFVDTFRNVNWQKTIWSLKGCELTDLKDYIHNAIGSDKTLLTWHPWNPSYLSVHYYYDSEDDKKKYQNPFEAASNLIKKTKLTNEITQLDIFLCDRTVKPYIVYSMHMSKNAHTGINEANWSISHLLGDLPDRAEYSNIIQTETEKALQYLSSDSFFKSCYMNPSLEYSGEKEILDNEKLSITVSTGNTLPGQDLSIHIDAENKTSENMQIRIAMMSVNNIMAKDDHYLLQLAPNRKSTYDPTFSFDVTHLSLFDSLENMVVILEIMSGEEKIGSVTYTFPGESYADAPVKSELPPNAQLIEDNNNFSIYGLAFLSEDQEKSTYSTQYLFVNKTDNFLTFELQEIEYNDIREEYYYTEKDSVDLIPHTSSYYILSVGSINLILSNIDYDSIETLSTKLLVTLKQPDGTSQVLSDDTYTYKR